MRLTILLSLLLPLWAAAADHSPAADPFETITFRSADGLPVTANLYAPHEDRSTPFIVLFHQAGWSRGEYLEIAPRLNELGFNCMAVDQRSGREVNGVDNETAKNAREKGKATAYVDAMPDMVAALEEARASHAGGTVIGWGSSYSASLVLKIAGDRPELVDGLLSFAPGEYFTDSGKPATWIEESAKKIGIPLFVTSARSERPNWAEIFEAVPSKEKVSFLPATDGNHGSRALWTQFDDSGLYWKAVMTFLERFISEKEDMQ